MAEDRDLREETEEEEDDSPNSIRAEKRAILKEMRKYKKTDEKYAILAQRLAEITECERNVWGWIAPTALQGVTGLANTLISYRMNRRTVRDVLRYEDEGNIVSTKATGFLKKPRE